MGFFSYFLLVRTASVFSGFKEERKAMTTCLYDGLCNQKDISKCTTMPLVVIECCGVCSQAAEVCAATTASIRGIDMQMAARARCHCLARWLPPPSSSFHPAPPFNSQLPQWDDPSLSEQTPTLQGLVRFYLVLTLGGQSKQSGRDSTVKNCCVKSMEEMRVRVMREEGHS